MQLLPPLTQDPRAVSREQSAGVHLPYARHVDDVTLETRDGLLMQTIRLGGLLFETADTEELNYRAELRDAMLKAIGSSRFALYHHVVRRRADTILDARYPDEFSRNLDRRWRDRLAKREMYVNELFLTIVRRPTPGRAGLLDRLRTLATRTTTDRAASFAAEKRALDAATEALIASLGSYTPRLLSVYADESGYRSEPLEFLSWLYNADMRPVILPHGDVGNHLPFRRVSFGQTAFELGATGNLDRKFGAVVSIKDYPSQTLPGMFDELYRMPFEMTVSQSFAFVERGDALGRMNLALRRMKSPGNFKYIVRKGLVSTGNFAGLASLHNFPVGQPRGNHWGDAVTLFETTAAGPYFFSFHHNDLGNFTIIGPSGSGKTVVLNFLLAQARKFTPRIVFFDKDRGAELFIRAIGGQYDRLRPGSHSGLNPLQLDDNAINRQFLIEWLSLLAGGVDGEEIETIKDAIDANFAQPRSHRRLRHLVELFRGHKRPRSGDLYARMRAWWGEGERAWLFDNEIDLTDLSAQTVGFDMTAILDDPIARTPALLYFFHRVEERLDGSPAIIVVDEGWKALDDDVFVRRIKDWEKTIRKRNGIVGFATQSAQDALESRIASAIIEQAATQIFMINPKARPEDYVDGFGLTQHEFELIRTLPDSSHCFLIKHGNESVVARLNLSGENDLLTILSGREATVRLFDELTERTRLNPVDWMAALMEKS
ncbi:MAG: VirB4 family type IV secretion/conjugal transfer ATPase [Sphingomonadales bacterium]|nr:VirB4 family type IV secretion/conjugal transfer ATPase [Sphingomonadales bacterium]